MKLLMLCTIHVLTRWRSSALFSGIGPGRQAVLRAVLGLCIFVFVPLTGLAKDVPAEPVQATSRHVNLLPNPSFEEMADGAADETLVPGWHLRFRWNDAANKTEPPLTAEEAAIIDDPAQARSGRRCLRLEPRKQRGFTGLTLMAEAAKGPIAPGLYELSAWFRGRPGTRGNFGKSPIGLQQSLMGVGETWRRNRVVSYTNGGAAGPFHFTIFKEGQHDQIKDPLLFIDDLSVTRLVSGLADVFGDHMVLQRHKPAPVWGWTEEPNQEVVLSFNGQTKTATSDADGRWMVTLDPMKAGGPHELELDGRLAAYDVMVGDVWLCSGQSNMEMGVDKVNGEFNRAPEVLAQANHPAIRLWHPSKQFSSDPMRSYQVRQDVWYAEYQARWNVCTPRTLGMGGWGGFSAVGYFFGREIQVDQGVAIGLMQFASGGTAIEAWMSAAALQKIPRSKWVIPPIEQVPEDQIVPLPALPAGAVAQTAAYAAAISVVAGEPQRVYNYASACFNSYLAPVFPMAARGVLWYQGEHNAGDLHYAEKLEAMIADWRSRAAQADLPFIIIQLCNWQSNQEGSFAMPREGQFKVSRTVPNTALAVTIDLADAKGDGYGPGSIHPKKKAEVGHRVALAARAMVYGEDLVGSGPLYRRMKREGDAIRLFFDSARSGLLAKGDKLVGFKIAGADRAFIDADAEVDDGTVVVRAAAVTAPVAVRYGFEMYVDPLCNLYNREGLPASPFRTDDWPLAQK